MKTSNISPKLKLTEPVATPKAPTTTAPVALPKAGSITLIGFGVAIIGFFIYTIIKLVIFHKKTK